MLDKSFLIEGVNHPISVIRHASSEDYNLIILTHLL